MGRPTTGKARKKGMCLTVSEQTRLELAFISDHHEESISALVSAWAKKEVQAICKRTGEKPPRLKKLGSNDVEGV